MNVREAATAVRDRLLEEHGDDVLAVGWYDGEHESRTGSVYLDEFDEYAGESGYGTLESALLESIGHGAYTDIHDERLTTTVRLYETVADIDLHLDDLRGVVVAVRLDSSLHITDVRQYARDAISEPLGVIE
ncbi:hypothetical protein [Halarchaeum sp. P4]|uniref:hypothetical protein n=1 Tax=Halarchaeum sp. P4 TaxID=3421639 RepID=UPI003EB8F0B0